MGRINLLSFIIVGIFCIALVSSASMTRTVPSTATPGGTFQATYIASDVSGTWGASIVDTVSGGCTFPDGSNQLKTVMLSSDGNTKIINVHAPSSGSCYFSGDYKFGIEPIVDFTDSAITFTTVECSANSDCPQNTCFGMSCDNGFCEQNTGMPSTPCDEAVWQDYPTCSWETSDCENEPPSFELDYVLIKIGNFEITILVALLIFGGLMVYSLIK